MEGGSVKRFVLDRIEHWHPFLRRLVADSDAKKAGVLR
jgi:hypothetical protein